MKRTILRVLVLLAALGPPLAAAAGDEPWERAQVVIDTVQADAKAGGLAAIGPHLAALEASLAGAKDAKALAGSKGIVLTDGPAETFALLAAAGAVQDTPPRDWTAVADPYPITSIYLGSYYDETGQPAEALRVLDIGLGLDSGFGLGASLPMMFGERGAALTALKRFEDSLANYDKGLELGSMADIDRARLYRGRGFSLIELNRLDEAEQAYRTSLELEPGNEIAQEELKYIAELRKGGAPAPSGITLPPTPSDEPAPEKAKE